MLLDTAEGRDWCKLIEGCLIPDFQNRLQDADEVLALVPQMQRVRPRIVEEQRDFQTRIINGVLLRIMQGEDYGKVYKLDDMLRGESAILSMGRKDDGVYNDIASVEENSSYISRKHCTLELDYDIGSWVSKYVHIPYDPAKAPEIGRAHV